MASERLQRRLERLLDQIDEAEVNGNWESVHDLALDVLAIDAENAEANAYLEAAERRVSRSANAVQQPTPPFAPTVQDDQPNSFANGRYEVKRFLGEGGKKRVYLAQDTLLDREVAFALIKTEGLDDVSRSRITREAQAMGRLGSHPHIVTVFDLGEHEGQPYMVTELMGGGDVEGVIENATDHRLTLEQAINRRYDSRGWLNATPALSCTHCTLLPLTLRPPVSDQRYRLPGGDICHVYQLHYLVKMGAPGALQPASGLAPGLH